MKLAKGTKNPFRIEDLRDRLAHSQKYSELGKTYSDELPEIKDLNSKPFWNERMYADWSTLESNSIYKDKINIISKFLSNKKGDLLDIGFMWGSVEKKIEKYPNLKISGIDISDEAVKFARSHLKGVYKVANIFDIPFKSNHFDFVLALDVLEHIRPSKVLNAYKEIKRVLKKKGTFIISIPINERLEVMLNKGINPVGHLRTYTPDLIKAELKLAGFKVLRTDKRYAFKKHYAIKSALIKTLPDNFRQPNLLIIFAKKI